MPHRTGGLVSTMSCRRCGVGHSILIRQTAPKTLETLLTVFPATGTDTISRHVIRWSFLTYEAANRDSEDEGYTVIRGTTVIGGTPIGR